MNYYYDSPDDLPVATLEQPGITQLNSNLHDIRIDQAATPYSVNLAYQAALGAGATASYASNNVPLLQAAVGSLSNATSLLQGDQGSLSNHLYLDVEPRVDATSNSWFASSNPLFGGVTSLQGDLGGLSNHLYLDVEPRADATSNSWFASSNPLFNGIGALQAADVALTSSLAWTSNVSQAALGTAIFGSNALPAISATALAASNTSYWTSNALPAISATALAASNTSYWTSNALPAISATALAASNTSYWTSNALPAISSTALAASNTAYWTSNALPAISARVSWNSNTAVAASNQAFTAGTGASMTGAVFTASNSTGSGSGGGVANNTWWLTRDTSSGWVTQTLPSQWLTLATGSYVGTMVLSTNGTNTNIPFAPGMTWSNCAVSPLTFSTGWSVGGSSQCNSIITFMCVIPAGQTGYISGQHRWPTGGGTCSGRMTVNKFA